MSALERSNEQAAGQNRRLGVERRAGERRGAWRAPADSMHGGQETERRIGERRHGERRANGVPSLFCPNCLGPLLYEAGLSWNLPGTYTVDVGYCPACSLRFLRNRETGDYDALSW